MRPGSPRARRQRAREDAARQAGLFALPAIEPKRVNPLLRVYGPGPEGAICRDCVYLRAHQQSKRWYKCVLRAPGGPATDHRVRWQACGRFEARP